MQKVYYYIGANNATKELETGKIEAVVSRFFEGFTAHEVIGYWHGNRERTLKVEVVTEADSTTLARVAKELCAALEQESVMMEVIESNVAFISQ